MYPKILFQVLPHNSNHKWVPRITAKANEEIRSWKKIKNANVCDGIWRHDSFYLQNCHCAFVSYQIGVCTIKMNKHV